jgi:hypothetical protein
VALRPAPARKRTPVEEMVGEGGHYLNSRIELGGGVLDLIRTHSERLEQDGASI